MGALKKSIFLIKKFGLFLCVPAFLFIAFSFVNSSSPKYSATAKITLKNVLAETAASDIKSKYLVQRTLDQLHFQVSYYDSIAPRREIYNDALPVRLVFNPADKVRSEARLLLKVTDVNSFELDHADTLTSHQFNEPIDEYYGRFSVVHTSDESYRHVTYFLELHKPESLTDQFYNNLEADVTGDKALTIKVSSSNPEKSVSFLNKLIDIYSNKNIHINGQSGEEHSREVSNEIARLEIKASEIKNRIRQLSAENLAPKSEQSHHLPDSKQLKIYEVIRPYLKAPARQFVQIPYTDEVEDSHLRKLLDQYNSLQLKKQHLIAGQGSDSAQVLQADNDLRNEQTAIVAELDPGKLYDNSRIVPKKTTDSIRALKTVLARIEASLQSLKTEKPAVVSAQRSGTPGVIVLESPKDNISVSSINPFLIYVLALLAGLLIPMIWWVIREPRGHILPSNLFSMHKISERINDLLSAKQID